MIRAGGLGIRYHVCVSLIKAAWSVGSVFSHALNNKHHMSQLLTACRGQGYVYTEVRRRRLCVYYEGNLFWENWTKWKEGREGEGVMKVGVDCKRGQVGESGIMKGKESELGV